MGACFHDYFFAIFLMVSCNRGTGLASLRELAAEPSAFVTTGINKDVEASMLPHFYNGGNLGTVLSDPLSSSLHRACHSVRSDNPFKGLLRTMRSRP